MESSTAQMQTGSTDKSPMPSPEELAAFQQRCEQRIVGARAHLAKAMAEAKAQGVPLHKIIPVS